MHATSDNVCSTCDSAVCAACDGGECTNWHKLPCDHYVRCIDEKVTRHEAAYRANEAMRFDYVEAPSTDVQDGYRSAFVDVALGASGEVPPVPPERYWSTCYRTAEGHAAAQDWFAGYTVGASRALATCRHQFRTVPSAGRTQFGAESTPSTVQGDADPRSFRQAW